MYLATQLHNNGQELRFRGNVVKVEETYFLVRCDQYQPLIFGYINDNLENWGQITRNCIIEFEIGFCMHGARAITAHLI
jgi:hypothetical protein